MRRVTLVIPYLLSDPEHESALRPLPPVLQEVVEGGQLLKLQPIPETSCPEAAFLGLDPQEHPISQGPLTVACLGHQPPTKSIHFHLSLATVNNDSSLTEVIDKPNNVEVQSIFDSIDQLRTKSLTPLMGEGLNHALVWEEGTLENETVPYSVGVGSSIYDSMPKGDGEQMLRQFIDDSINLLNDLQMNHIRREEGRSVLNCLWPWGQGIRPVLPNLSIRRGDIVHVSSDSIRLAGLCNLVGYKHSDRSLYKNGMATDFSRIFATTMRHRLNLILITSIREMQIHERIDEIAWTLEQMSLNLLEPLLATKHQEPFELRIAAIGGICDIEKNPARAAKCGLGVYYSSQKPAANRFPFDERSLDEPQLSAISAHRFILGGLIGTV